VAHIRLFNHYMHTPYIILGMLEYAVLMLAVFGAFHLRFPDEAQRLIYQDGLWIFRAAMFALVMHGATLAMGVYQSFLSEGFLSMVTRTVVAYCLLGCALFMVLHLLIAPLYLGNTVLVIAILLSMLMITALRWCFFHIVGFDKLRRRVVFFGAGRKAQNLLTTLRADSSSLSVDIIGCVPSGQEREVDEAFCLDCSNGWLEFARKNNVGEIVVVPDERRRGEGGEFPLEELLDCKLAGISVVEAIKFCERETGKLELGLLHPGWMLFSDGFRYSKARDVVKRGFDLFVAGILLLLIWPFMLLTALAVYLESGGPVLYSQLRTGLNGKDFRVYKFRSMVVDAEKDGKAVWATARDSRITRVGAFIRNTRLDELPQLYNVFRGNMSFIGPRPERPEIVCDLIEQIPYYDLRHRVKPGLMGWAQLKFPYGASVEDSAQKLRYDLYYSKNHSFLLDILILIQTAEVILLGKGVR